MLRSGENSDTYPGEATCWVVTPTNSGSCCGVIACDVQPEPVRCAMYSSSTPEPWASPNAVTMMYAIADPSAAALIRNECNATLPPAFSGGETIS